MKTTEKAKQLVDKFTMDNTRQGERNGIKCAIIAVEELMEQCREYIGLDLGSAYNYWNNVKQEIEKLIN
jgi:hypothetical protein